MEPHLRRMGAWLAGLSYDRIPAEAKRAAKMQLADVVAAVHASARAREADSVRDGAAAFASRGRATVIATRERLGPADAALVNAAFSMAQDFDDIVWMGHTCHSAVFASLAVAEHEEKTTRDLVCAIVAANEIGGRLGASSILGPLNGQMWTFIHLVGAAAATAKLLSLDAEQTTHALAIALAQPNFALQPGFLLPGSKLLAAATPTASGIQAAYFARAGMTGYPAILEDSRGFWRRFSYFPLEAMLDGLGDTWLVQSLAFKTYPGCHYFQTALSAIDRIRERTPMSAKDVRTVRIDTTQLACEATRFASEYVSQGGLSPVAINFDLALSAAVLLGSGRLSARELDARWLAEHGSAVRELASRIHVAHDPELTAQVVASLRQMKAGRAALRALRPRDMWRLAKRYRQEYRSRLVSAGEAARLVRAVMRLSRARPKGGTAIVLPFPNRVTIDLEDGRREIEQVDVPVGTCSVAGSDAELAKKFRDHVQGPRPDEALRALLAAEEHSLAHVIGAACGG